MPCANQKSTTGPPSIRLPFAFVAIVACAIGCGFSVIAADEGSQDQGEDSSTGLPDEYAKNYPVARSTVSPDKKFNVIYPTLEAEEAADKANDAERIKDYIVALQPFTIIKALDTKLPYFQHENNGGLSAEWSDDSAVGLITLDGKMGSTRRLSGRVSRWEAESNNKHRCEEEALS